MSNGNKVSPTPADGDEWRSIPTFERYLVSARGLVFDTKLGRVMKQSNSPTSKGSYKLVSLKSDIVGRFIPMLVHRLVCMAFHGLPSGDSKFVNHKDGDKHNNHADNLEWVTRNENLEHSYDAGLRSENRPVYVVDLETGERVRYRSMTSAVAQFGFTSKEGWRVVMRHRDIPYQDRYLFQFDSEAVVKPSERSFVRDIVVRDYRDNQVYIFSDSAQAALKTGIDRNTILWHLRRKDIKMFRGHCFQYMDSFRAWPEFSQAKIEASLRFEGSGYPIEVINTTTQEKKIYKSINAFAEEIGEYPSTIRQNLKRTPCRFKHYHITSI